MTVLNAPPTLFHHQAHVNDPEGNSAFIDVRVRNQGASDSFGAVFITGFGPSFTIYRFIDGSRVPVSLSAQSACSFELVGIGGILPFFNFNCGSFGGTIGGDGGSFRFNIGALREAFGIGWLPDGVVNIGLDKEGRLDLQAFISGVNIQSMFHGKILISMLFNNFNFHAFGGTEFTLRGNNPEFPGGGEEIVSFQVRMNTPWRAGTDQINIPYQIKSCYAYTTFVSPEICIDPRPNSDERKVCQGTRTMNLGTQGAPVAVTSMQQINTGRSVQLRFEVRNVGNGRVWDVGALERCSPYFPQTGTGSANRDIIYIGYVIIEDQTLECNTRTVRLNNGRGEFICTYDFNALGGAADIGSAYVTPLRMELWYGYEELISRNLRVIRAS